MVPRGLVYLLIHDYLVLLVLSQQSVWGKKGGNIMAVWHSDICSIVVDDGLCVESP